MSAPVSGAGLGYVFLRAGEPHDGRDHILTGGQLAGGLAALVAFVGAMAAALYVDYAILSVPGEPETSTRAAHRAVSLTPFVAGDRAGAMTGLAATF